MTTTLTSGANTISPNSVVGYSSARKAQTVIHVVPGKPSPDTSLRPASLRSGRITLAFLGAGAETASKTAEDLLSTATTWALASTDRPSINMAKFSVAGGDVLRTLDRPTGNIWWLEVPFQELS